MSTTATKTARSYRVLPNGNVLVTANGKQDEYRILFGMNGVASCQKTGGQIYAVDLQRDCCECKAYVYGGGKPCKHLCLCRRELARRAEVAARQAEQREAARVAAELARQEEERLRQEEWSCFDR